MTTPVTPAPQTRQQLEELDALLQRMLSLPLSPSEAAESPNPLPPVAKVPLPLPPAPPVLLIHETPAVPGQPNVQAWRVQMPSGNAKSSEPTANPWVPPPAPVPTVTPRPLETAPIPPSAAEPIALPSMPVPSATSNAMPQRASAPPLPVWLWPFYLLNLMFDLSTYTLGPFSRWLSYPATKHVMGWLGVMMILLSVGFAVSLLLGFDWGNEVIR